MILYPFNTTVVESPYQEVSGNREILTFHFEVVALWDLDARKYFEQKDINMYSLLPTMAGATADMLLQVIRELEETYEGTQLSNQLLWLKTLLNRATILSPEEKKRVKEKLAMFESIFEADPYIQEVEARGELKGKIEGKIEARKSDILEIIETNYPQLTPLVQQKLEKIQEEELLKSLLFQIYNLRDEQAIQQLFTDLP